MTMPTTRTDSPDTFQRFLRRSLDVLQRELPAGYAEVATRLGRRAVKIEVDGERLCLMGDGSELSIAPIPLRPAASASGTSAALRAILEGKHTLDSAILADAITLQGTLPQLAAFYETLRLCFSPGGAKNTDNKDKVPCCRRQKAELSRNISISNGAIT